MNDPYYIQRLKQSKEIRKWQKKIKPLSEEIKSVSQMLLTTITALLIVATIGFLHIRGVQSAKGYQLDQLQKDNEALLLENRELQSQIDQANSLNSVSELENVQEMVKNENLDYVGPTSGLASNSKQ